MWTVHTSQAGNALFAQARHFNWDFTLAAGALIGVVGLGIWALYRLKQWREQTAQDVPLSPQQLLEHYQQMVDDGLLDPQEFARIQEHLQEKASREPAPPPSSQPPDTSIHES